MKTMFVAIALMTVPLAFAVPASADWTCGTVFGVAPPVAVDACSGDTNADNPYAACNGNWQDLYEGNTGTYVQTCDDGTPHVWVCPASYSYSYQSPACVPVSA